MSVINMKTEIYLTQDRLGMLIKCSYCMKTLILMLRSHLRIKTVPKEPCETILM